MQLSPNICVSIVSHGHGEMVSRLVNSLLIIPEVSQIILTKNIPEKLNLYNNPKLTILENMYSRGFGENHNHAFSNSYSTNKYFCVLNPDITFNGNPLTTLVKCIETYDSGVMGPLVLDLDNEIEDSARYFPTIFTLINKYFFNKSDCFPLSHANEVIYPDWIAGMFMLFRSSDYRLINGFDESFYLYCEDIDICARSWMANLSVALCMKVSVIHDARRESHSNIKFMKLHFFSMLRFFYKHFGRLYY